MRSWSRHGAKNGQAGKAGFGLLGHERAGCSLRAPRHHASGHCVVQESRRGSLVVHSRSSSRALGAPTVGQTHPECHSEPVRSPRTALSEAKGLTVNSAKNLALPSYPCQSLRSLPGPFVAQAGTAELSFNSAALCFPNNGPQTSRTSVHYPLRVRAEIATLPSRELAFRPMFGLRVLSLPSSS
jgi:hypothetical protein